MSEPEHPAIAFNKWFDTAASGEPFFPGLYTSDQLRAVAYLAWVAGRESLERESLAEIVGFEACWYDFDGRHCRKPKGHDGDCAPF